MPKPAPNPSRTPQQGAATNLCHGSQAGSLHHPALDRVVSQQADADGVVVTAAADSRQGVAIAAAAFQLQGAHGSALTGQRGSQVVGLQHDSRAHQDLCQQSLCSACACTGHEAVCPLP
jgi:hypothetical protein